MGDDILNNGVLKFVELGLRHLEVAVLYYALQVIDVKLRYALLLVLKVNYKVRY